MGRETSRPWIDAVNDLAVRHTRTMHRALQAWTILLTLSTFVFGAFVAFWWIGNEARFAWFFPLSAGCASTGCWCREYWGARTMALPWFLALVLHWVLVPGRAPVGFVEPTKDVSPYRTNTWGAMVGPDASKWLQLRRARRALIASAMSALLVACACLDSFALFPPRQWGVWTPKVPELNGVALLNVVFAAMLVIVYRRAARLGPS